MTLSEDLFPDNPFELFSDWYEEAVASGSRDPHAMTLATADMDGRPSARIVLMKEMSQDGLVFYTSYSSRKGRELLENPFAALVFFWVKLRKQIRIEGKVFKTEEEISDSYFVTRPKGSRLGAWVSPQSEVIPDRRQLLEQYQKLEKQYSGKDIPRPPNWGGFILKPSVFEFWHEKDMRLHDRIQYRLENDVWTPARLAP